MDTGGYTGRPEELNLEAQLYLPGPIGHYLVDTILGAHNVYAAN